MYIKMKKAKTTCVGIQHIKYAVIIVYWCGNITAAFTLATESFAHLGASPVERHHQVQVYQACNDIHLVVEIIFCAIARITHPGMLF